jgi:hypothetical protein
VVRKTDINGKLVQFAWWALAAIVFTLVVAIRIRLFGIPLERDAGEYAYAGQLMLQGIPPYKLAYNMKFPGTYAVYVVVMSIFGQTISGIHLGLLLVNAATAALVFFLSTHKRDGGLPSGCKLHASLHRFEFSPAQVDQMVYAESAFPAAVRIADYLREHTTVDDTIAVDQNRRFISIYTDILQPVTSILTV